ncbi:PLD nuclease N-terminal domain-containing protein [Lentibacillus sp. CBA3610]|uniref:PLD nuclease N-terminal domain-containing protein n=1 Tax=Lentibacillus sp. CBA3610 TaxID=2518176 RepID=UPI0015950C41|nr:PLD nuclease N-terminal domain-containing protein [Lentibacillus sp. CBA3610]QKY68255.1 PLDc_N domain-containing protein [Lentibacillus sp. CBA3610]
MEEINSINEIDWTDMLTVIVPMLVIQAILLIAAIIDLIRIERTNGPKWAWALVIVFINIIGPIIYFIFGRRND